MLSQFAGLVTGALLAGALTGSASAADPIAKWPQFRGPDGTGLGDERSAFPTEFGPDKALIWKMALPKGHGSPCIWGDRIFVTAFDPEANKLELIAVDRKDGEVAWRREIEAEQIQKVHAISSPANSTPVTDGETVYAYFGSVGLLAFDWDGNLIWLHDMGVAKSPFGTGSSPIIAGDLIVINRDYPPEPYLLAVNRIDGTRAWEVQLEAGVGPGPKTSHATPLLWRGQVLLHRPGFVSAFGLEDGRRLWWAQVGGTGTSTLAADERGVYVAAFGANAAQLFDPIPFKEALAKYDADEDGKLNRTESPEFDLYLLKRPGVPLTVPGAHFTIKSFFGMADGDKSGLVDEAEYHGIYDTFKKIPAKSGLTAIRPEGEGDLSLSAIRWAEPRGVPEAPSPLVFQGRLYAISNGGILTCIDAEAGDVLYRGRVNAPGAYYASPVAAGGRVVVASSEGVVTVLGGGESLEVLSNNDLAEPVFGTPALTQSEIYVRSLNHLWAFGADRQDGGVRSRANR